MTILTPGAPLAKSFLFVLLITFSVQLPAQLLSNPPLADAKIQMASLRPQLVWQRTSPKPGSAVEGPVLYQIIFRSSATPGNVPVISPQFTLMNSHISDSGSALTFSESVSFAGGQTFPGAQVTGTVANATSATTASNFSGPLTGDVTGTQSATTVGKLQGVPIANTAPTDGQLMRYSAASGKWQAASSLFYVMTNLGDYRNNSGVTPAGTWWNIPNRTLSFTKSFVPSHLKVTYQDTLGMLGQYYDGCEWQILLDGGQIAFFSTADLDTTTVSWRMNNAAHEAWALGVAAGAHTVVVQNRGNRGAWGSGTQECLQGWNTTGNFLSVEEMP